MSLELPAPTLRLAVNQSPQAEALLRSGEIRFDLLKCPAWPDMVKAALATHTAYVHFPLRVGMGAGDAEDTETRRPPDWDTMEALLALTETPWVSLHLAPQLIEHPAWIDRSDYAELLLEAAVADVEGVIARFGRERVIVENIPEEFEPFPMPCIDPLWITRVVEEAGCGFLLDTSHARRAARYLGIDEKDYVAQLPLAHTREVHVTGIQRLEGPWLTALGEIYDEEALQRQRGSWQDHLPMTDADWGFFAWAMEEVRAGHWGRPEIVAFEYGGVGPFFRSTTSADVLRVQVPRLWELVHPAESR